MAELVYTDPLNVTLRSPDHKTIIINPNEGRKIDLLKQKGKFFLYTEREEFIEFTEDHIEVVLEQHNDFQTGCIKIKASLHSELEKPEHLKVFRKNNYLYLKPVTL